MGKRQQVCYYRQAMKYRYLVYSIIGGISFGIALIYFNSRNSSELPLNTNPIKEVKEEISKITHAPTPTPTPLPRPEIPSSFLMPKRAHMFQSFNNCGPAALSMALSHYGINKSQAELGQKLRPYQHPTGDNDDKSTTLEELAEESKSYNLTPFHRPNGDVEKIKQFVAAGFPVITRTLLKSDDDIGHYRVVRGYNDTTKQFTQDDSLQGADLKYSYDDFLELWKPYNYEYLVLVTKDKENLAKQILQDEYDVNVAWENSLTRLNEELEENPNDMYTQFNLATTYYHLGKYEETTEMFEKVESRLPMRTLWYQIEPILAYQKLKDYDRVFEITNKILSNNNRAFSELYLIRGEIYLTQGETAKATAEFKKAVTYNRNFAKLISDKYDIQL